MSEEEKQVNEAVEALKKENEEYLDSLKRLKAEFENYQKRVEKESTERAKFGSEDLILKLLKLKDSFERALSHAKDDEFGKGVKMILNELERVLAEEGVKAIEVIDKEFDVLKHEAIGVVKGEKDKVVEEVEKGYQLFEKIIRPAKVKVGQEE
ncbi:nucleotide exchange factor GrpE [Candidatus Woesearchaeota archaeon]|nr:nucleotide exchange factor GrpE [Candidatus Woesearchaeota archaeon]